MPGVDRVHRGREARRHVETREAHPRDEVVDKVIGEVVDEVINIV